MPASRVSTLSEAVAALVRPGMTVALEGFGHLVPMAAAHEIIRPGIRDLTVCRMSCDMMIARYVAGAAKLPFYPIRSYDASELRAVNDSIRQVTDPYSGEPICVVPPLNPDVSIIHAQRADRRGNVQA